MKIQILGSGCSTCKSLHKVVEETVKKLNLEIEVEYSTDITKIIELGAMSSPVFAIDGVIIESGKVPSNDDIEKAICVGMKGASLEKMQSSEGGCSCEGKC